MRKTFGDILKSIRLERQMTQDELAEVLGTSKQVISRYENNQRAPKITVANEYAKKLDIPLNALIGEDSSIHNLFDIPNIMPLPKTKSIPLIGNIACGTPVLAIENIEEYLKIPININADFALRCQGDSMINARIFDGDIVFIKIQPDVNDGDIAAVLIGEEATLKRVKHFTNKLVLRPENPMYDDVVLAKDELDDVRILGKAVMFISVVR